MGFFSDIDINETNEEHAKRMKAEAEALSSEGVTEDAELMEELLSNFNPLSDDDDEDDEDEDYEDEEIVETEEVPEPKPSPKVQKTVAPKKPLPSKEKTTEPLKNKEVGKPLSSAKPTGGRKNIILAGTIIDGNISTEGDVEIGGSVNGNVASTGNIHTLPNTIVRGDAEGKDIIVEGKVCGKVVGDGVSLTGPGIIKGGISASGNVVIGEGTSVIGDVISENDITINGGVKGNINSDHMVTVKSTAIIQGDIVSALVSIEPGAALDGTCKQAYAKVSPAEYFANMEDDEE